MFGLNIQSSCPGWGVPGSVLATEQLVLARGPTWSNKVLKACHLVACTGREIKSPAVSSNERIGSEAMIYVTFPWPVFAYKVSGIPRGHVSQCLSERVSRPRITCVGVRYGAGALGTDLAVKAMHLANLKL